MKGLEKAADFRASDAIFDPPVPRDTDERRTNAKSTLLGLLAGGAAGAGAGYGLAGQDHKLKGIGLGAGIGGSIGSIAGEHLGGYNILKKRDERGEEVKQQVGPGKARLPHKNIEKIQNSIS